MFTFNRVNQCNNSLLACVFCHCKMKKKRFLMKKKRCQQQTYKQTNKLTYKHNNSVCFKSIETWLGTIELQRFIKTHSKVAQFWVRWEKNKRRRRRRISKQFTRHTFCLFKNKHTVSFVTFRWKSLDKILKKNKTYENTVCLLWRWNEFIAMKSFDFVFHNTDWNGISSFKKLDTWKSDVISFLFGFISRYLVRRLHVRFRLTSTLHWMWWPFLFGTLQLLGLCFICILNKTRGNKGFSKQMNHNEILKVKNCP